MNKQEGHDGTVSLTTIIALTDPALEMIKGNILTDIHDDNINKEDTVACLMDYEIYTKVKYG